MKLWRWLAYALGGLLAFVGLIYAWGALLPLSNSATRSIEIARPPAEVWAVMLDPARAPKWQPMVKELKILSPVLHEIVYTDGMVARVETTKSDAPRLLEERTLPDPSLPFRAHWDVRLEPTSAGTRVTSTSTGEIDSPLIRWAQRYVFPLDKTLGEMLDGLKRECERGNS
ncbi:MAG: SRPBCC family protein [Bryobacteraceae bacterium]|nr:SRPBCC family protein [Bryobacteraceae bacterium]